MNPEILSQMFAFNQYCIKMNTEDLTQSDSLVQPHSGGNCLNWVLGHIVATRKLILEHLGESPIWSDEEAKQYIRGSKPIQNGDQTQTLDKILTDFNRSQKIIVDKLSKMSAENLSKKVDEKDTLAQKLVFLHFHETYHIGQTGLLRRIAGKEGAIR